MVDTAIKVIFSDEIIERLVDLVMEAQQQENTRLPVLKEQFRDTDKQLANLLEVIEQGILTPTTKRRLDKQEARKEALNTSILEDLKNPVLTRAPPIPDSPPLSGIFSSILQIIFLVRKHTRGS